MTGPAVPDRRAPLRELLRAKELESCLAPFLYPGFDGAWVFDAQGASFAGAALEPSPLRRWGQLPAEAHACLRRTASGRFGLHDHVFELRSLYAGTDRVGVLIVSRPIEPCPDARDAGLVDGLHRVLGQMLQAGFAAWVTSEMHLATSEEMHRALQKRQAELERAVDHLRELDGLKSNFLATVSHELRTPLTSVIGFSEMLLEGVAGPLGAEQRDFVRTILQRGEELLRLISEILEMSQLEVGAVRLDLQACDARPIVDRAAEAVAFPAAEAGVRVQVALDRSVWVIADPAALHRVLVNLLTNAIKFSPRGGAVTVTVSEAPLRRPFEEETLFGEESDDAVRVTVSDEGIGIAAEKLGRIFEPFYQIDASSTRQHGGAGLGLAIVRSLIEAHGGDVWAESVQGQGTKMHVTLPRASDAAVPAPAH